MVIVVFVLVTVPSDRLGAIIFTNGAYANLNLGAAPTTVTAPDQHGKVYKNRVLVSMEFLNPKTGRDVTWDNGTAQKFVQEALKFFDDIHRYSIPIRITTQRSRTKSQNVDL